MQNSAPCAEPAIHRIRNWNTIGWYENVPEIDPNMESYLPYFCFKKILLLSPSFCPSLLNVTAYDVTCDQSHPFFLLSPILGSRLGVRGKRICKPFRRRLIQNNNHTQTKNDPTTKTHAIIDSRSWKIRVLPSMPSPERSKIARVASSAALHGSERRDAAHQPLRRIMSGHRGPTGGPLRASNGVSGSNAAELIRPKAGLFGGRGFRPLPSPHAARHVQRCAHPFPLMPLRLW